MNHACRVITFVALLLIANSGDRLGSQAAGANARANELTVVSSAGSTASIGVDFHSAMDGSCAIVRMPMVPNDQGADSSFCWANLWTRTGVVAPNPATGKWDGEAHAAQDTEITGSLTNTVREPLWIVSPWMNAKISVTAKSPSLQPLSFTRYKLDAMCSMHLTIFKPDGTLTEMKQEAAVKLYNLPVTEGGRDISAQDWLKGETVTYVLKPSDKQHDGNYGVTVAKDAFIAAQLLVREWNIHFTYGGTTNVAQDAEVGNLEMLCASNYDGQQGELAAYDLRDAANNDLKNVLSNLPSDPADRFQAILNAQRNAKVLTRTPAKSNGTILDAHWKLP